jgi:Ser/Thr protein kinase RdoA (MazF antagonist)
VPSHPLLTEAEIARCADRYGWRSPRFEVVRNGVNLMYRVEAADGRWYLRVTDPRWRRRAAGEAEAQAVASLLVHGAPLVAMRNAADGAATIDVGPRWAICSAAAPGDVRDKPDPEGYAVFGAGIARLHLKEASAADLPLAANGVPADLETAAAALMAAWPEEHGLPDALERLEAAWRGRESRDDGVIHGDMHTGNCAVDGDAVTFFDSECLGWGPRCYDLGVARWTMRRFSETELDARWRALLAGYRTIRPLDEIRVADIRVAQGIRRVWQLLVAARMPWRYEPDRFRQLGVGAAAAILADLAAAR